MTTQCTTSNRLFGGKFNLGNFALEGILVLIFIFFTLVAPGFFSSSNLFNILRNISMQGIIAFGMTMVIISGEIDLSVGSVVAFAGCLAAVIVRDLTALKLAAVYVVPFAMLVAIGIGFISGVFSGWLRTRFNVPSLITTLALMSAFRGGAYLITNSFPILSFPQWYNYLGGGYIFGVIPFQSIIFIIVFGIMYFVSKYTTFGRSVYAIGGNAEAARLSGIKIGRIRMSTMAIVGSLAAISGLLVSSQVQAGSPMSGVNWEMDVISAVIIGGVSLTGGKGRIWGTFIGIIFIGIIQNGMVLLNIDQYWQYVTRAILILGAVLIYQTQESKK